MGSVRPKSLLWVDIEATTLPKGNDFSDVHIMEIACILTGYDWPYEKASMYYETLAPSREAALSLKDNPFVLKMHKNSGLLDDWKGADPHLTAAYAEKQIIDMLERYNMKPQETVIAGSGVAMYDYPLIKDKMPELAKQLAYFTFDTGVLRRTVLSMFPGEAYMVPDNPASYGDGEKEHRALADIQAHLREMEMYSEWIRGKVRPPF